MLGNRPKSLNPLSRLGMGSFAVVLASTVAMLLLLYLTIPARNARLRVSNMGEGRCGTISLKTSALYFEHTGDEDKPIDSLIIATSPPVKQEIQCAVPRTLSVGSHWNLLVVNEEEFSEAVTLLNRDVPTRPAERHADFQFVLVSKRGRVQIGPFSDGEAIMLFADLARYFEKRQPDLQEKLTILIGRLGGPHNPQSP